MLYRDDFYFVEVYFAALFVGVGHLEEDGDGGVVAELAPGAPQVDIDFLPLGVGVEPHDGFRHEASRRGCPKNYISIRFLKLKFIKV